MHILGSGFVAAGAVQLGSLGHAESVRGQVVVLPFALAQDAHRQALGPQEDAGVLALLDTDITSASS